MAKVFFFNIPFYGHINTSLALVEELVGRGEEVIYYCTDTFKEKIQNTGAVYRSYGTKFFLNENFVTMDITEICKVHIELTELIIEDILEDIKNERPDYIVHDTLCTWAKYAAQISKIPAVNVLPTLVFDSEESSSLPIKIGFRAFQKLTMIKNIPNARRISKISRCLKRKYGIRFNSLIDIIDNKEKLNIVFTSKEFQSNTGKIGCEYSFVGPVSVYRSEDSSNFTFRKPVDKPLGFISMGTLFNNNTEFFNQCFEAFKDMNIDILMSVGKNIHIPSLRIPANFTVMHYYDIPQLEVLKICDVFITHGGMNSVHEALFNGVPLVAIPQQSEQEKVCVQMEKNGCGIRLNPSHITSEVLNSSVKKIISIQSYRVNAVRIRDSFIAAGGPKRAADVIFSFTNSTSDKVGMN